MLMIHIQSLHCPKCGGALKVDKAVGRTLTCQFCNSTLLLALDSSDGERSAVMGRHPEQAEQAFRRGLERPAADLNGKLSDYSEAIRHDADYAEAYFNRGVI